MPPPAPPASTPRNPHGQMSSRTVLGIVGAIGRGQSFRIAARSAQVSDNFAWWKAQAGTGDDPFWAWAVAAVEQALAQATGVIEEKLYAVATGEEDMSPSAVKAQAEILRLRSPEWQDAAGNGPRAESTSVHVTVNQLAVLLGAPGAGGPTASALPARSPTTLIGAAWDVVEGPTSDDDKAAPVPATPAEPVRTTAFRRAR